MKKTITTNRQPSDQQSRRRMLCCLTGAGVGLTVGSLAWCEEIEKILKQGDKIDLDGRRKEIIEKAYELGYDYEKKYGGCAQCTVAALQDAIPFVPVDKGLFRGAGCLDGGATPVGTQNCGAFTGSGMVIGYLCGRTRNGQFKGDGKLSHKLIHKVYDRFKQEYGSVLCEDVLEKAKKDCPEVVGRATRWTAEVLLEEFTNHDG